MQTIYLLSDPITSAPRYVGATNNLRIRINNHLLGYSNGRCKNWIKSVLRLGLKPLVEILEVVEKPQRQDAERAWILGFRQTGADLTNLTDGGEGRLGYNLGPETKSKISASKIGKKRSPETIAKVAAALRGRKHSPETREACRVRMMGNRYAVGHSHPQSQETKERLRTINLGKMIPRETREKISKSNTGRKHSPESIANMRSGHQNLAPMSEETKAKIRLKKTGLKHSPDTKAKLRAINLGKKQSPETVAKKNAANTGKKRSPQARTRMSMAQRLSQAKRRSRQP